MSVLTATTALTARGGTSDLLECLAHRVFEPGVRLTLSAAGIMLCVGVCLTVFNSFLFFVNKLAGSRFSMLMDFWPRDPHPVQLTRVKLQLGYTASVALQLLVVADVLDTLVKPALAFSPVELCKLGGIVAIRTVLAFFLNAEVREAEEELESDEANNVTI